jgi:hypothetical protein
MLPALFLKQKCIQAASVFQPIPFISSTYIQNRWLDLEKMKSRKHTHMHAHAHKQKEKQRNTNKQKDRE